MSFEDESGTSRRDVLRGGAIGMSAVMGALGLAAATSGDAEAAAPDAATPNAATTADHYWLLLDGITGESTSKKGQIDISSWSWGATQAASGGAGGAHATSADLHLTSHLSKASPHILQQVVEGKPIDKATLSGRKAGEKHDFLVITMHEVVITSYKTSATHEIPAESYSLEFESITFAYYQQKRDGSFLPAVQFTWRVPVPG